MKDYIEYMDNIAPDPALKGKILKRARSKPASTARLRTVLSCAGMVATAAVLLLGMWIMPGAISNMRGPAVQIINNDSSENDDTAWANNYPATGGPALASPAAPGGQAHQGGEIVIPDRNPASPVIPPPEEIPQLRSSATDAFHFSSDGGTTWDSTLSFAHPLTREQFISVFPNVDPGFAARAVYSLDGNLIQVYAYDTPPYYHLTHTFIQVGTCESSHHVMVERMTLSPWTPQSEVQVSYIHGVQVTTQISGTDPFLFIVSAFMLDGIGYTVTLSGAPAEGPAMIEELVRSLIESGPADLSVLANPEIPELRSDHITVEEARLDPDFGMFMPANIPIGMRPGITNRMVTQYSNYLLASWDGPANAHFRWMIRKTVSHHHDNVMTAQDFENLDRTQPAPASGGEASSARRAFAIQVVSIEDFTFEMLESLAVYMESFTGDVPGWWVFSFAVIYGDVVIEISAGGLTARQIWDMLPQV